MVCRKIEQERPDQGRFVQDGAAFARQYTRVNSKHTQLGLADLEESGHLPFPVMRPLAHALCGISPIGETSPVRHPLTGHFSATYDWSWDCLISVAVSLQERIDAENSEDSERRGRLHAERSHGRRECSRVGNAIGNRTKRPAHLPGLKGSHPRGSRCCHFSGALRGGQHHAQELSGLHPRMDYERTTWKLIKHLAATKRVSVNPALGVGKKPRCGVVFSAAILQGTVQGRGSSEGLSGRSQGQPHSEMKTEGRVPAEFASRQ
jgi:hypothetical protein